MWHSTSQIEDRKAWRTCFDFAVGIFSAAYTAAANESDFSCSTT
jgi:hypothetical protein